MRSYGNNDSFQYLGHEISLHPQSGAFYCRDFGVEDTTIEGLKAQIKERVSARKNHPKIAVLFEHNDKMIKGLTTGVPTRPNGRHVWVSFKLNGHTHREQVYYASVYPDTKDNRERLQLMQKANKEIEKLEKQVNALDDKLDVIQLIDPEDVQHD